MPIYDKPNDLLSAVNPYVGWGQVSRLLKTYTRFEASWNGSELRFLCTEQRSVERRKPSSSGRLYRGRSRCPHPWGQYLSRKQLNLRCCNGQNQRKKERLSLVYWVKRSETLWCGRGFDADMECYLYRRKARTSKSNFAVTGLCTSWRMCEWNCQNIQTKSSWRAWNRRCQQAIWAWRSLLWAHGPWFCLWTGTLKVSCRLLNLSKHCLTAAKCQ